MVKINSLEIENIKRVRAVKLEPAANGLTVIGGKNNQGKTSVLDAIAWALGGDRYRPSQATREGSVIPPHLHLTLSNGIVVERKGKNSELKVTDPEGHKGGQQLLNAFLEPLALDLPKFMHASEREKADTLLRIIGVGDELEKLERKEKALYDKRRAIGQIADQKKKFAREQTYWPDVPNDLVSASELIRQQQVILAKNGENQRKRERVHQLELKKHELRRQLDDFQAQYDAVCRDCDIAQKSAEDLQDESTEELERNIAEIDAINAKVRDNLTHNKAEEEALEYDRQYESLTSELATVRANKANLLDNVELPLEGLSVENGALTYHGQKWDNMSGSEQLKVSTAIVRKLKPECGFVLLDGLEQMDLDTLREFGAWLESQELQAIATLVSTGGECSIIITDGIAESTEKPSPVKPFKQWKKGEF